MDTSYSRNGERNLEYILQIDEGELFNFKHALDFIKDDRQFHLHYHPYPEIYLFVNGVADFYIEGAIYNLEPYDIMLVPPYMLHQPYPQFNTTFERYFLNIFPGFYDKLGCPEYKNIFSNLDNFRYKIPARVVKKTNYINVLNDIRSYSDNFKNMDQPIIKYKVGELLHILNSIENFEIFNTQNPVIQEIIDFIDKNYATIANLDEIVRRFNYTKSHLCVLFKEKTGMTIVHYLTLRRIEAVKHLHTKGKSLSTACLEAGFGTYGNFAYNYKKIFGKAPKEDLK